MKLARRFVSILSDEKICKQASKYITPIDTLLKDKFNINRKDIELYGDYKCKLKSEYIESVQNNKKWQVNPSVGNDTNQIW